MVGMARVVAIMEVLRINDRRLTGMVMIRIFILKQGLDWGLDAVGFWRRAKSCDGHARVICHVKRSASKWPDGKPACTESGPMNRPRVWVLFQERCRVQKATIAHSMPRFLNPLNTKVVESKKVNEKTSSIFWYHRQVWFSGRPKPSKTGSINERQE